MGGGRTVVVKARRSLGANPRTAYRIRLTRDCVLVATGVARGSRLELQVKASGTRQVSRDGRVVSVAVYPRLRGRYWLQPAATRPRIAVTALTLAR